MIRIIESKEIKSMDDIDQSKFEYDQLEEIRLGLESGVDVSKYADPKYDRREMYKIRLDLNRKLNVSKNSSEGDPKDYDLTICNKYTKLFAKLSRSRGVTVYDDCLFSNVTKSKTTAYRVRDLLINNEIPGVTFLHHISDPDHNDIYSFRTKEGYEGILVLEDRFYPVSDIAWYVFFKCSDIYWRNINKITN